MKFRACVFDTETSGLISDYSQDAYQIDLQAVPYVVQLAYIIFEYDTNTKQTVLLKQFNSLIQPKRLNTDFELFEMPQVCYDVHHHSIDDCKQQGIQMIDALKTLSSDIVSFNVACLVAHNAKYDTYMLDYECARVKIDRFMINQHIICTKNLAKPFAQATGNQGAKLIEMYAYFYNKQFENAHDALADVNACAAVFIACCERTQIWPMKDSVLAIQTYSNGYHPAIPNFHTANQWHNPVQIDIVCGSEKGDVYFEKHLYIKNDMYDEVSCAEHNVDINKCKNGYSLQVAMQLLSAYIQCSRFVILHGAKFHFGMLHSAFKKCNVADALLTKRFIIDENIIACYMHPELSADGKYIKREDLYKKHFNIEPTIDISAALSTYKNFCIDYAMINKLTYTQFIDCLILCVPLQNLTK